MLIDETKRATYDKYGKEGVASTEGGGQDPVEIMKCLNEKKKKKLFPFLLISFLNSHVWRRRFRRYLWRAEHVGDNENAVHDGCRCSND